MPPASSRNYRGARLLALRQIEGLAQGALAKKLGVTQAFVSHVENGLKSLPHVVAEAAADLYALPLEFFSAPPSLTDEGFATFRKSSKATVRDENRVVATFGDAARLFDFVSRSSGYHSINLHEVRGSDAESTAKNVRSMLEIPAGAPLLNATRAVERLGVGVIHDLVDLPDEARDHAGVTRPNPFVDRPLVATIGRLPPEVARMTVLHELAHIIFDGDRTLAIQGTRSLEEKRAFRFAGAMMLPAETVRERVTETLTLQGFLPIKAKYGISVAAIIVRSADLGVISPERKRTLMIQMSSNGWRRHEPVPVAEEKPILISQATTRAIGSDARTVARAVGISYANAERWTGLPMEPQSGALAEVIDLTSRRRSS